MADPLELFSLPVRLWFRETFGQPTPPQAQGWPPIQAGQHTLILAPTGSGKTLAAFLWGIDEIYRELGETSAPAAMARGARVAFGIRLLYVSPLKALNNDIERNLRAPLAGIRSVAERLGQPLPPLRVAVRTGDTPGAARAAMLKHPPHILITTPESLFLMLTSPRARDLFRTVRTVIVDEIHTLCGNKRGVHLSLSLERLEHLAGHPIQRIGLSATIRPLDEVARFLGGQEWQAGADVTGAPGPGSVPARLVPRPVTVVDTGYRKPLDLQVVTPVEDFRHLPGRSIWPSLIPRLLGDIMRHRSTLIFCNNRRLAERTADRLNAQIAAEQAEEVPPGSTEVLAPAGLPRDRGIFAIGAAGPIRAHHGSMSKEARRQMEEDLKAGRLPALVGTGTLELGIDIGAIDLVVQVQSPRSVSQGLQRVGRSGHLVGQTSVGRIYATYREELDEAAAVARGMLEGDVEPTTTPRHPLDVLAQQIVAMVAVEEWSASALFDLVRQAYAYGDLSADAFRAVLDMLAGRYAAAGGRGRTALRARIAWDRVNDRLAALPGSRLLALANAGTITDTGAYDVYLADGKTRLGQLDEEFIFETRVGDTFLLGSNTWRVLDVADDRIIVAEAAGAIPRMPFWRGDYPWRTYELGCRIGRLRRELAERITQAAGDERALRDVEGWLQRDYLLDENSARNLVTHVSRQLDAVGVIASDQTIVVESFGDALGEPRMVVHSPFGGRVNGAWALALGDALSERVGIQVETQAGDDGILLRFPSMAGGPPVEIVSQMTPAQARSRILAGLPRSAVFGAHFRMNAARALLLPKARGRKRTPFWLQRLKAKDLLATVLQFEDFPLVAETYRDCLQDVFDLPHLEQLLADIQAGRIRVVPVHSAIPSPVAAGLLQAFVGIYMYEWDVPKAERQLQVLATRSSLLDALGAGIGAGEGEAGEPLALRPEAVAEFEAQTQRTAPGYRARSADELAVCLQELGDLTTDEVSARCTGDARTWLAQLGEQGRITQVLIPAPAGPQARWVPVELAAEYRSISRDPSAGEAVLRRYLRNSGPVTCDGIRSRYGFDPQWLDGALGKLLALGEVVRGRWPTAAGPSAEMAAPQFCDRHNLERILHRTLGLLRREVQPVPLAAYAEFLLRWQGLSPGARRSGQDGLRRVMEQLRGVSLPAPIWERDVLPARLTDYRPGDLGTLCQSGELVWACAGPDPRRPRVTFFARGEGRLFLEAVLPDPEHLPVGEEARAVYRYLREEGASFLADLQAGTGLPLPRLRSALAELVLGGYVTNDTLEGLQAVLTHALQEGEGPVLRSSLESELAQLRGADRSSLIPGRMSRDRFHAAERRVARRLKAELEVGVWPGRWSPLHRAAVLGPPSSDEERAARLAQVLLTRYGVIMREVVEREGGPWGWAALVPPLQSMELRGEVRRGYFVAGLSGLQYALPEAVEDLRSGGQASERDAVVVLNAMDPANLYGGEVAATAGVAAGEELSPPPEVAQGEEPGSPLGPLRFARLPSTHCVLWHGEPVLVAEDNAERLTTAPGVEIEVIRRALEAYLGRPNAPRRLTVRLWNRAPAPGSPGEPLLQSLGFYRTPTGLEWWAPR